MTLIASILMASSTAVTPSSGQVTFTSTVSPTDFDRTFKNRYSISNVGKVVTSMFLVKIHDERISTIASLTCLESFDSSASINIFSSRTRNG